MAIEKSNNYNFIAEVQNDYFFEFIIGEWAIAMAGRNITNHSITLNSISVTDLF